MKKIKVGSRDSKLAVIQAELVMAAIRAYDKNIETELVTMKTTGDKILNVTLDKIGGKGLFVKELDEALTSGAVDITVHSFKDMPMEINPQLPIVALSRREDPRDVMIFGTAENAPIGCSSARRRIQLEALGFGEIQSVRGNVQTRLAKLDRGEYSSLVLAAAGIKRLQLEARIGRVFSTEEIIPAACQGILAVQARAGEDMSFLTGFHSPESQVIANAERAFVSALNGGCSSPMAAYARPEGKGILLFGMYVDEENRVFKGQISGSPEEARQIGIALAQELKGRSK